MNEFLVETVISPPDGTSEAEIDHRVASEARRATQLRDAGHLVRIWRPHPVDDWRNVGLWRAVDREALSRILATLPLAPWMTWTIRTLGPHPADARDEMPPAVPTDDDRASARDILHHGMVVGDLDAAIEWYVDVLGLRLVHRQRQDNDYTRLLVGVPGATLEVAQLAFATGSGTTSTHNVELIEYLTGGIPGPLAPVARPGSAHLAFLVDDIDAVVARVQARGGRLRNPPVTVTHGANTGARACYLHDPDGNTLELMQRPRGRGRRRHSDPSERRETSTEEPS